MEKQYTKNTAAAVTVVVVVAVVVVVLVVTVGGGVIVVTAAAVVVVVAVVKADIVGLAVVIISAEHRACNEAQSRIEILKTPKYNYHQFLVKLRYRIDM